MKITRLLESPNKNFLNQYKVTQGYINQRLRIQEIIMILIILNLQKTISIKAFKQLKTVLFQSNLQKKYFKIKKISYKTY